jgi:hypothetical protein
MQYVAEQSAIAKGGDQRIGFCQLAIFLCRKYCLVVLNVDGRENRWRYMLDRYLQAIEYCATRVGPTGRGFEPWVVNGEIIAGLEPPQDSIAAIDWITGVGAIPTVCVFRPLAGTDYRDVPPPAVEDVVPVFRRLYAACMERGLPIGIAPDLHVSLVMLPEEARWLQDDPGRFRAGRLKLKAMRALFARRLQHELRRTEAAIPAA